MFLCCWTWERENLTHFHTVYLCRFGKVEDAVVMYDKKTGRSRGFGFITYDSPDVVRKVSTRSSCKDYKMC